MTEPSSQQPPKRFQRLLRFFLKKEFLEEIEGDMDEIFHDNLEKYSYERAKRIYAIQTLKLVRPILIRRLGELPSIPIHRTAMFRNYFKVSVRGLLKNPVTSFINIFGLALAIAFCVLIYGFTRYTFAMDQFHVNKNEVFLATFYAKRDGTVKEFGKSPRPLGEMLKNDFPQVTHVCRIEDRPVVMESGDRIFHEQVRFTDPDFLEMFTFPLQWGSAGSLADPNTIILSKKMSAKYFGTADPVGENILLKFASGRKKTFRVTGVAQKFPESRTIDFDCLVHLDNLRMADSGYDAHDWTSTVNATLIQVSDSAQVHSIESGMDKYRRLHNAAAPVDWAISSFAFEPLALLPKHAGHITDSISDGSDDNYTSIVFLVVIGSMMLALACLNYINIAIVTATKRLKEIGVRKSIGATRKNVIIQFLSENVVTTFFALILGILLGRLAIIPWFEQINHFSMDFRLANPMFWLFLAVILLVTALASGIYPSLYISRFEVVSILKGSLKFGRKNPLTKIFLTVQLTLACIFLTSAVMFTQNSNYMAHRSWGYNQRQILYVPVPDHAAYEQLSAGMAENPDVLSFAGSGNQLGLNNATAVVHFPNHQFEVDQLSVDANYFNTLGLQLTEGRSFADHYESDKQTIVVNETLVSSLHLQHPIGQSLSIDSVQYRVIGVLKDVHSYSFFVKIKPTLYRLTNNDGYRYLSMRVRPGAEHKTLAAVQSRWAALYPEIPFEGGYQEAVWGNYYESIGIYAMFFRGIATSAILLVVLGLYGLVKLNVAGRVREFSIRKVLGAGIRDIAGNIVGQYTLVLLIALVAGAPLSYSVAKFSIEMANTYHMPLGLSGVFVALIMLVAVVALTIFTQIRKVQRASPVDGLKTE